MSKDAQDLLLRSSRPNFIFIESLNQGMKKIAHGSHRFKTLVMNGRRRYICTKHDGKVGHQRWDESQLKERRRNISEAQSSLGTRRTYQKTRLNLLQC
jgi:hypothetical protein